MIATALSVAFDFSYSSGCFASETTMGHALLISFWTLRTRSEDQIRNWISLPMLTSEDCNYSAKEISEGQFLYSKLRHLRDRRIWSELRLVRTHRFLYGKAIVRKSHSSHLKGPKPSLSSSLISSVVRAAFTVVPCARDVEDTDLRLRWYGSGRGA